LQPEGVGEAGRIGADVSYTPSELGVLMVQRIQRDGEKEVGGVRIVELLTEVVNHPATPAGVRDLAMSASR
jgi:hypothetical protein